MRIIIILCGLMGLMMYGCQESIARQERFAIEHNCRWDYNDICYTREQRPWLFK
ncbi:MAG: hypothetical protein J6R99_01865 [Alphaproteobacteria bacterium]|nr:hypothetical protein [Alphaproteobacteria bacterium]